jgi:hypothetical protein
MASTDIPFGSINELHVQMTKLADDVIGSSPYTPTGDIARRRYRIAVRQLEVRAKVAPDQLIDAMLYSAKFED